ncbi:hypothetical protein [Streptomyces sp. NRRL S-1868]|uniref:hypothetical protein n=1 Tax=Streptomyces sp. NRRL S-1868 TaxID=1463892 RepID=UPI0004C6D967|nr:hypothetical protein [Streptomyces sp. NRRL S-1868]
MKIRISLAIAAVVILPVTAACSSDTSGNADTKPSSAAKAKPADGDTDCGADSDLSQSEWTEKCADDAGGDKAPTTELKVGDTFKYDDGLKVTVAGIQRFTQFGEYDVKPDPSETPFRINIKFENGGKQPVNLDDFSVNGQGATKGGDAEFTAFDAGSKEIAGRLAPGQSDTKTSDGVLDKKYGSQLLVTVSRMDEANMLDEDPNWTGPIR